MPEKKRKCIEEQQEDNSMKYPLDEIEALITAAIKNNTGSAVEVSLGKTPPGMEADFGVQLAVAARKTGWGDPVSLASTVADEIRSDLKESPFKSVETTGPYLNVILDMEKFGSKVVNQVAEMGGEYGKENIGKGKVVVIDMSSPNIAKRMTIGHLRSTIIGDALANVYRSMGHEVIRDNHLGDWGTQFGKQMEAIKRWGNEEELFESDDPIGALQKLYVKFHAEAKKEEGKLRQAAKKKAEKDVNDVPGLAEEIEKVSQEIMDKQNIGRKELNMDTILEDALDGIIESDLDIKAREWFLRLEKGDKEARRLWKLCMDLSLKEFDEIYKVLGVDFEETLGESFYEPMLPGVIEEVKESGKAKVSEGALIFDLTDKKLGVAIVQKKDGATVYMTRDLATAFHREKEMKAHKAIYVVGAEQKHYFKQLFEILKRLGHDIGDNSVHVYFGKVNDEQGKSMSTRKGNVILLRDVIKEGLARAEKVIDEKEHGMDKKLKERVIRQIAIGALKWNDLSADPKRNIDFNWDVALSLHGYSAPYVQYAAVRCNSILKEAENKTREIKPKESGSEAPFAMKAEKELVKKLAIYSRALRDALETDNPSKVAVYVYELAKAFNSFYVSTPVLAEKQKDLKDSRLKLVHATQQVITNALGTLGIEVPEAM